MAYFFIDIFVIPSVQFQMAPTDTARGAGTKARCKPAPTRSRAIAESAHFPRSTGGGRKAVARNSWHTLWSLTGFDCWTRKRPSAIMSGNAMDLKLKDLPT